MSVTVRIVDGALGPAEEPWRVPGAGALVEFEGVVRPLEGARPILALDYEVYAPMAGRQLRRIAQALKRELGLVAICVEHSHGRVPIGERSFRLRVAAEHRQQALEAVERYVDLLKRDVPIWKKPVLAAVAAARADAPN